MQPLSGPGRGTRLSLLGIGLLVLLSVVAFASRSGLGHRSSTAPSPGYVNYAVTVFLILFALMIPVAVYAFLLRFRERSTATRKSFKARLYASAVRWLALVLIAFVAFFFHSRHPQLLQHLNPFRQPNTKIPHDHSPVHPEPNPEFQWNVLWVALVLFAGLGAFGYRRWRAGKLTMALRDPDLTVSEEIAASIDDAIEDLEAEPDARRAVIAAYARMEGVLARHGRRRNPSETPVEYLGRILGGLTSRSDAVARLTGLFEEAKFSRHEIDGAMKSDAIDALRAIRDDVQDASA